MWRSRNLHINHSIELDTRAPRFRALLQGSDCTMLCPGHFTQWHGCRRQLDQRYVWMSHGLFVSSSRIDALVPLAWRPAVTHCRSVANTANKSASIKKNLIQILYGAIYFSLTLFPTTKITKNFVGRSKNVKSTTENVFYLLDDRLVYSRQIY